MDCLYQVCDREIIENESEYRHYIAALRKKDDKSKYKIMLLLILIWMKLIKD